MEAEQVARAIYHAQFRYQNEKDLQRGIAQVLLENKLPFVPEVSLTKKDRIDFLVGRIGIEVKVDGSLAAVTRQLFRYAERPEVDALILVTTRQAHRNMPDKILGKSLYVVWLLRSFL